MRLEYSENRRRRRLFAYAPLFLWIVLILILGSSTGSMAQTSRFIRPLIEFLFPSASPETILMIHAAVRKSAHFVEYAVLAILAARALGNSASNWSSGKRALWILVTVVAVAIADEFIQSFNGTRTGSPYDVLLDLAGGVAGLILFAAFGRFRRGRTASR